MAHAFCRSRLISTAFAAAVWWAAACPCPAQPAKEPAKKPATKPAAEPLPAEATMPLEKIPPVVAKPVNPPDTDKLTDRAKDAVIEGEKLLARRDYSAALERLERAVGFQPDSPRIRRALGRTYLGLANRGKAVENLRRAMRVAPDDLEIQLLLAKLALAQKQTDRAIQDLRAAMKCGEAVGGNSLAGEALLLLAELLEERGNWRAALDCYTDLSDRVDKHGRRYMLRPKLKPLVARPERLMTLRGKLLLRLRRSAEAVKLLEGAYRRNRTDPAKARLLIESLIAAGSHKDAEKLLVDMATEPALQESIISLVTALCKASDDKALPGRIWETCKRKGNTRAALALSLAQLCLQSEDVKQAAEILASMLRDQPGNLPVAGLLSRMYVRQNQPEKALRIWADVIAAKGALAGVVTTGIRRVVADVKDEKFPRRWIDSIRTSNSAPLFYVAGELALLGGQDDLASRQFGLAVKADEKFAPGCEALLRLHLRRHDSQKADALLERMRKALPGSSALLYAEGLSRLHRRDARGASALLDQANKTRPGHLPTLLALGEAYSRSVKLPQAVTVLGEALTIDPDRAQTYRLLFSAQLTRRLYTECEGILRQLKDRKLDAAMATRLEVELLLEQGKRPQAMELLKKLPGAAAGHPDVRMLALRVRLNLREGILPKAEHDRAIDVIGEVVDSDPDNEAPRRLLAALSTAGGKSDKALAVWQKLRVACPKDADVIRDHAAALIAADEDKQATAALEALLKIKPDDDWGRRKLLGVLEKLDANEAALAAVEGWLKAAEDKSSWKLWCRVRVLGLLETTEKYDRAQKVLDDWIGSEEGLRIQATLRAMKLQLYGKAKQVDKAAELALARIRRVRADGDMTDLAAMDGLIRVLADAKQFDRGHKLIEQWLPGASDREKPTLRQLKLLLYAKAGKTDQVIKEGQAWAREDPRSETARAVMVVALSSWAKRDDLALQVLEGWLKELAPAGGDPPHDEKTREVLQFCRETSLRILLTQQKYPEALKRCERFVGEETKTKRQPNLELSELLNLKATCLSEMQRTDDAIAALKQAMTAAPEDKPLGNNLGYIYADNGVNLVEAEKMILAAVEVKPTELAYLDSLGWVYYKTARLRLAGEMFHRIMRRSRDEKGEHPVLCDHAGDVFYRLGWREQAVGYWTRAVELAKKEKRSTVEIRQILTHTPRKIKAVADDVAAPVAPLGKGVSEPSETPKKPDRKKE